MGIEASYRRRGLGIWNDWFYDGQELTGVKGPK